MKRIHQYSLIVLLTLFVSCDKKAQVQESGGTPDWFKPDYGEDLHVMGRPSLWDAQHKKLGNTGFTAAIGANVYQDEDNKDPDSYSIDVEFEQKDSSLVCFNRDFEISSLPKGFLDKDIDDVVSFDPARRKVTFAIGGEEYVYILPMTK